MVQVTLDVTLKNVTPSNNLLLNSYFENPTVGLHVLYDLNMYVNFHANQMQYTIWSINSSFMHYFKLLKLESRQLIDDMTIDLWSPWNFESMKNIRR